MVFKNIERIKKALPEITHLVMFYDEGVVYQTTFEPPTNIPQLGKDLAKSIQHFHRIFDTLQLPIKPYKKLIYEVDDFVIIILKLGEHSNLALFFQGDVEDFQISAIRYYLFRLEELIDIDQLDIERNRLKDQKEELNNLEQEMENNLKTIQGKKEEINSIEAMIEEKKKQIDAIRVEIQYEDTIQDKLEQIVIEDKEKFQNHQDPSAKESIKTGIEEEKKGLKLLKKTYKEKEEFIEKMNQEIGALEKTKLAHLSEINSILERNQQINEEISQANAEISILKEKIDQLEKKKFEKKFLD
jgi:hypothetical protein